MLSQYHGCGSYRGRQDSMITHCGLLWHCYVSRKSVGMYKALRAKPELSFRGCPQFQSGEDVTTCFRQTFPISNTCYQCSCTGLMGILQLFRSRCFSSLHAESPACAESTFNCLGSVVTNSPDEFVVGIHEGSC